MESHHQVMLFVNFYRMHCYDTKIFHKYFREFYIRERQGKKFDTDEFNLFFYTISQEPYEIQQLTWLRFQNYCALYKKTEH